MKVDEESLNDMRFGNFRKNFIFTKSIKRYISDVKNSRLRQNLPISINDSDFAISRGFYFHETLHVSQK